MIASSTLTDPVTLSKDYQTRRRLLQERLPKGARLVLHSGSPVARNYPSNPYPFRANSTFLYFLGWNQPQLSVVLQDHQAVLYFDPPTVEDAVWEGAGPDLEELKARYGLDAIRPRNQLPERLLEISDPEVISAVIELRLYQDAAAQAQLGLAAVITNRAHLRAMEATRPGLNEVDILGVLHDSIARDRAVPSFSPIVSVHGEVLHNHHSGNLMKADDLLLIDFGAETSEGWAGDVTRTFPVSGKFTPRQREIYSVVLAGQAAAIEACVPGRRFREVHRAAARTITAGLVDLGLMRGDPEQLVERGAHALFFPHGIGHLLGLDVHDMEEFGDRAGYPLERTRSEQFGLNYLRLDRDLRIDMAVTIEPGFYWIPQLLEDSQRTGPFQDCLDFKVIGAYREVRGIRIEDDVLVTAEGPQILTRGLPKTPDEVEAVVGLNR